MRWVSFEHEVVIHEGGEKIDPEEGKASSSENLLVEIANVAWNRFRAKVRLHVLRGVFTVPSWMVSTRSKGNSNNRLVYCKPPLKSTIRWSRISGFTRRCDGLGLIPGMRSRSSHVAPPYRSTQAGTTSTALEGATIQA